MLEHTKKKFRKKHDKKAIYMQKIIYKYYFIALSVSHLICLS